MIAAEQASNRAFEKYRDACKLYKRAKDHIFHNNEMEWNRRNEAKIRGDMAFETFEAQSLRDKRLGSFEDHERIGMFNSLPCLAAFARAMSSYVVQSPDIRSHTSIIGVSALSSMIHESANIQLARGQYDRAARPGASFQDAHTPDSTHRWRRDRARPVDDSYIRAVMELEHQKMLAEDRKEEAKKHEQEGINLAEVEFQPWLMRVEDHWDQAKRREQEETGLARADRELRWMEEEDRREQARKRELEDLRLANAKLEQRWMEEEARREKAKKREQAQYIIITNPNIRGIAKSRSIIPSRELGPDERGRRRPRPSFSRKDASLVEAESTSTDQSDDESATSSEQESSSADQSDEQETDSKSSIKETCSHHATVETAPDSTVEDLGSKFIPDRILRSSESDKSKVEVVDGTSVVEKKEEDEGTNEDETKKGKDGEKEETPDGSMTKGEDVEGNGKGKAQ